MAWRRADAGGLEFFRHAVDLQRRHSPPGREITNGLQTNGLLLDPEWTDFLARENFSVGLSLDGPVFAPAAENARSAVGGESPDCDLRREHRARRRLFEVMRERNDLALFRTRATFQPFHVLP